MNLLTSDVSNIDASTPILSHLHRSRHRCCSKHTDVGGTSVPRSGTFTGREPPFTFTSPINAVSDVGGSGGTNPTLVPPITDIGPTHRGDNVVAASMLLQPIQHSRSNWPCCFRCVWCRWQWWYQWEVYSCTDPSTHMGSQMSTSMLPISTA